MSIIINYVFLPYDENQCNSENNRFIRLTQATDSYTLCSLAFQFNRTVQMIIEPGVISISSNTFKNCSSLEWVDIPNTVTIWKSAFSFCVKLSSLRLPTRLFVSVTHILLLRTIIWGVLPDSLIYIGHMPFFVATISRI